MSGRPERRCVFHRAQPGGNRGGVAPGALRRGEILQPELEWIQGFRRVRETIEPAFRSCGAACPPFGTQAGLQFFSQPVGFTQFRKGLGAVPRHMFPHAEIEAVEVSAVSPPGVSAQSVQGCLKFPPVQRALHQTRQKNCRRVGLQGFLKIESRGNSEPFEGCLQKRNVSCRVAQRHRNLAQCHSARVQFNHPPRNFICFPFGGSSLHHDPVGGARRAAQQAVGSAQLQGQLQGLACPFAVTQRQSQLAVLRQRAQQFALYRAKRQEAIHVEAQRRGIGRRPPQHSRPRHVTQAVHRSRHSLPHPHQGFQFRPGVSANRIRSCACVFQALNGVEYRGRHAARLCNSGELR